MKRTGKPMSKKKVFELIPQILDALKVVHDANIWHLDLKPSNIMLDKNGNVKLIDFGASKQLDPQKGGATTDTRISYTPGFAPREQMEQNYEKFGPWTDIYALGATLYNLLTNKRPPLPTDIDDDITTDKHEALPFPNGVSKSMKDIVLWMMKPNRVQRPKNVDRIIDMLKEEKSVNTYHQQQSAQDASSYNNEATIISEPHSKKKKEVGCVAANEVNEYLYDEEDLEWTEKIKLYFENDPGLKWLFGVFLVCLIFMLLLPIFIRNI
jgi:serine/threonine protein kinase